VSSRADFDLSGRWAGMFNYPELLPPNGFEAVLTDVGGAIGGTISERSDGPCGTGESLISILEGRRRGSSVTFTKMYEDSELRPDAVFYSGTIEPDGNEISGRWEIPGAWAGTFLMVREAGVAEAAETEVAEEVTVPRP
jgi:hypothetical protein